MVFTARSLNIDAAQGGEGLPTSIGNGFAAAGFAAGYFETGYRMSANQVLYYGQNIDGKIRSAQTLTRANRIASNASVRGLSKVGTSLAFASGITVIDAYSKGEWHCSLWYIFHTNKLTK